MHCSALTDILLICTNLKKIKEAFKYIWNSETVSAIIRILKPKHNNFAKHSILLFLLLMHSIYKQIKTV